MQKVFTKTGFTLVETLIVVGIITLIVTLSFPFYKNFIKISQIDNTVRDLQDTLRRANNKAQSSHANSQWGVHFETQSFVLFSGSLWSSRNTSYDENHPIGWGVSISSPVPDIIFTKSGTTTTSGSIVVSDGAGNNKTIIVNNEGVIELP